jgi:DNA polymerase-3 subunit gamma/tau
LDVVDLDASLQGGFEEIRELLDLAALPPAASRFRVVIIDQAHKLSPVATNALLGTVEEPPGRTVFIFTTDKPDRLPSTLRSRMFHYPLRLLGPTALTVLLEGVCQREGVTVEPGVLPLVVQAGGGSARQALTVLEQLLAGAGPEGITHRNAVALVGDTDPVLLNEMIDALAIGDAGSMFGILDRALRVNDDAWMLATSVLRRLRDLVILASVPTAVAHALIDVSPGQVEKMTSQAALMGAAHAIRLAEAIAAALAGMQGNIAPRLVLELCCARAVVAASENRRDAAAGC